MIVEFKELSLSCFLGDHVKWKTLNGQTHVGILLGFDNGTAIVNEVDENLNEHQVSVRCS